MKTFLLIFACAFALQLNSTTSWTFLRRDPSASPGSSFIATVRFTIRNITSNWKIPETIGVLMTGTKSTTVPTKPNPRYSSATTKRVHITTNPSTTTTSTTTSKQPFINSAQEINEHIECNPTTCNSEDIEVLEKCNEYCLHLVMNTSANDTDTGKGSSTEKPTTSESDSCIETHSKCTCHYDLAPVCGTNGKTYSNLCEMECEQKCVPDLKLAHVGRCDKPRKRT